MIEVPDPKEMIGCGIVLGVILCLVSWGLCELAAALFDVTITFTP
jgi:short subunit fatty acids transporter